MLVSKETLEKVDYTYTEEELKERELLVYEAQEKLKSYNLKWTYRGISYLVNREGVSLNSLRSMLFKDKIGNVNLDLEKAVYLLVLCGLISTNKLEEKDYNDASDKSYEIMEDWTASGRHLAILHCLIINTMTEKHFFIDNRDSQSLDGLALLNIEKSLALRHLAVSEETKMQQMYNYNSL